MFSKLIAKLNSFGEHHQVFFAIIIGLCIICISWSIEKILEEYIFSRKPLYGYLATIAVAVFLLWLTKHVILHAM